MCSRYFGSTDSGTEIIETAEVETVSASIHADFNTFTHLKWRRKSKTVMVGKGLEKRKKLFRRNERVADQTYEKAGSTDKQNGNNIEEIISYVFLLIGVVSLSTNRYFSSRKWHDNLIARK